MMIRLLLLLSVLSAPLFGESVRLQWDWPTGSPQPMPQSYAIGIYGGATGPCPNKNWTTFVWENTNSSKLTYVVTRAPGCYEFTASYYVNGQIQGVRSNFVLYTIKPGEVAAPEPPAPGPPKTPYDLRIAP